MLVTPKGNLFKSLRVGPQVCSADDMDVTVALALHAVMAEIREYTESVGRVHSAHIHRQVAHPSQQTTAPYLYLAHVFTGHDQQHQWYPGELVYDDH